MFRVFHIDKGNIRPNVIMWGQKCKNTCTWTCMFMYTCTNWKHHGADTSLLCTMPLLVKKTTKKVWIFGKIKLKGFKTV